MPREQTRHLVKQFRLAARFKNFITMLHEIVYKDNRKLKPEEKLSCQQDHDYNIHLPPTQACLHSSQEKLIRQAVEPEINTG